MCFSFLNWTLFPFLCGHYIFLFCLQIIQVSYVFHLFQPVFTFGHTIFDCLLIVFLRKIYLSIQFLPNTICWCDSEVLIFKLDLSSDWLSISYLPSKPPPDVSQEHQTQYASAQIYNCSMKNFLCILYYPYQQIHRIIQNNWPCNSWLFPIIANWSWSFDSLLHILCICPFLSISAMIA